jgi:hypothetical protein
MKGKRHLAVLYYNPWGTRLKKMKQFLKKLSALTFFFRQERRKSAAASETDRPFCRLALVRIQGSDELSREKRMNKTKLLGELCLSIYLDV